MRIVADYALAPLADQLVRMPQDAEPLSVQWRGVGGVILYARIDPDAPLRDRRFLILETGEDVPGTAKFVATGHHTPGRTLHVFDCGEQK